MIEFPEWVEPPTPCKTRTFKVVIPKINAYRGTRHGAAIIEHRFPNRPTVAARRLGLPGFYTKWADQ